MNDGSGSELDTSSRSPSQHPSVSQMEGFHLPSSLHGLSLVSSPPTASKLLEERTEVLARKPLSVKESPANSTSSTLTFVESGTGVMNKSEVQKLTKSAKRRIKKKQKQQKQNQDKTGLNSTGPNCLKLPCMQPSTSGPSSQRILMTPVESPNSAQREFVFRQHLRNVLTCEFPKTQLRFQAQGIRNLGSTCFLASAIQFLIGCPEFCWLMTEMTVIKSSVNLELYSMTHALGSLAEALQVRNHPQKLRLDSKGPAIEPNMLSSIVRRFQMQCDKDSSIGGRDVQEFLLFILDQTERELLQLKQAFQNQLGVSPQRLTEASEEDDAWMVVGKKNKISTQRSTGKMESSILSSIFGGRIQGEVKAPGMVPSITTNPFTTLVLDILPQAIYSIEDALELYTSRDSIPDYKVPGSHQTTLATQVNLFKELPKYLVLCLKQYTFNGRGIEKMHKFVSFGSTLKFKRGWMADGHRPQNYQLLATCNHHGSGRGGDHYTANVLQDDGVWLNFNDSTFDRIQNVEAMSETPYLLLYGRL
eukprot:g8626.t1